MPYSDYEQSAASLDRARLGKQRVEAFQVLTIIEHLKFLGQIFNYPYPTDFNLLTDWIKEILAVYKKLPYFYIFKEYKVEQVCSIDKEIFRIDGKEKVVEFKQQGYTIIKIGFSYHPCVKMWFYHTNSLKEYINVHINEWIKRGYNNNMKIYLDVKNEEKPYFATLVNVNHRSVLYKKEVDKYGEEINKNSWYILKNDFIEANGTNSCVEYIWPIDRL